MKLIDLRSDTVTKPTPAMRRAMADAEVGDDVYGEDPTVNRLQERAAETFGKEAALYVPTGTMGNQICVRLHTRPGTEVILEERSHIFNYEMGSSAVISGVTFRPVRGLDGLLSWDLIAPAIHHSAPYYVTPTSLLALENSHNMAGGAVLPIEAMNDICDHAHALGLPVHLDGARVFNAALALGASVADIARPFDSVMFCLSKGLGAPVGSMIVGRKDFIKEAVSIRKLLGGGMRQVGVLSAAGLIALEESPKALIEDHANAKRLAEGVAELRGVQIDPERVQTNIVIFDISASGLTTAQFSAELKARGVLANGINPREMRMVTHYDVSRDDIEQTLKIANEILKA
ncbi:MAG TPA: GntG family PLP-dependent aldolase [Blastocatellia bacterium]|nr:GntG family PLP-dependent aldolase [Blastocatellia bacterium]HMY72761.1 GntG family PLP-dependent aldolase [Blastocatellia bacterium]HMZ21939.1 GntG family PLP-dependent aldolase [Blastocatellia bacterium]HNG30513.1 GntG family PLP-dependent aldolase [Blastocatellia bacterium]